MVLTLYVGYVISSKKEAITLFQATQNLPRQNLSHVMKQQHTLIYMEYNIKTIEKWYKHQMEVFMKNENSIIL